MLIDAEKSKALVMSEFLVEQETGALLDNDAYQVGLGGDWWPTRIPKTSQ
jgi:hypothetical protein